MKLDTITTGMITTRRGRKLRVSHGDECVYVRTTNTDTNNSLCASLTRNECKDLEVALAAARKEVVSAEWPSVKCKQ